MAASKINYLRIRWDIARMGHCVNWFGKLSDAGKTWVLRFIRDTDRDLFYRIANEGQ